MGKLENKYQSELRKRIEARLPGCTILKNDSGFLQGIPDLTILHEDKWAVLEVKKSPDEPYQPNQEWYLEDLGRHSFTATIYPENENEVLDALQQTFRSGR